MTSAGIGESQETRDAEKPGSKRLTKTALALQSAVSAADIDAFTAMGVIGPVDTAGLYDPGDVTRLRLVVALRESGIDLKRFAAAIASGSLSLDLPPSLQGLYSQPYGRYAYAVIDETGKTLFSSLKDNAPIFAGDPRAGTVE